MKYTVGPIIHFFRQIEAFLIPKPNRKWTTLLASRREGSAPPMDAAQAPVPVC